MLPSEPILHLALFGGLAALKLPACNSGDCMDCPACTPPLSKLAARVPRAHRLNSTVVCAISGQVMDADNPPLAFPSGHVYSRGVRALPPK
jgi:macrophage erythroblast attacher